MKSAFPALALLFAAGVAHADDIEVDVARVARADFTTRASSVAVERAACSLGAHAMLAGEDRPLDVRVEHQGKVVMCPVGGPNGLTLAIRVNPGLKDSLHVLVETDAPPNATAETLKELQDALRETTAELSRRSDAQKPAPPPPEVHVRPTRAFSPALTVTGIVLAALGIGAAVGGYGWMLSSAISFSRDAGGPIALMVGGGGAVLLGALFAVVGEHRVPADPIAIIPGGFRF